MLILKANTDSEAGTMPSEELISATVNYNQEQAKAGILLDAAGLYPSSTGARIKVSAGGKKTVVDGPFTESKELVAGYWIIEVKLIEEAIEWAKRAPVGPGQEAEIEVRQFVVGGTVMTKIFTTLGPKTATELGLMLPHEHIFVDFRPPHHPEHGVAEVADVVALMVPEVEKAQTLGVTAMVDCTPVGVGRRVDILKAVSEITGMPLVAPTGIYREPCIPAWAYAASEAELTDWMLGELQNEIQGTGVKAGWIKLGVGDDGITDCESKILRAAAKAGRETNAVIGVHTKRGRVVRDQFNIIEAAGYTAERFIWIHTQSDPDFNLHLEMAQRGAWLEYDGIGYGDDAFYLEYIPRALDAGLIGQMMLSHDRGWYDPAKPNGGVPKPFTYLMQEFLPKLTAAGVDEATIHQLAHTNPYRAFAR